MSTPLEKWVEQVALQTRPERIVWCDGSDAQQKEFFKVMLKEGHTVALNPETHRNCFLHRSNPNDVARTEKVTFICTPKKERRGADEQLDGSGGRERKNRKTFRRRDGRPHDVCDPLCDGAAGFAHQQSGS